jgi:hypothetical protein
MTPTPAQQLNTHLLMAGHSPGAVAPFLSAANNRGIARAAQMVQSTPAPSYHFPVMFRSS